MARPDWVSQFHSSDWEPDHAGRISVPRRLHEEIAQDSRQVPLITPADKGGSKPLAPTPDQAKTPNSLSGDFKRYAVDDDDDDESFLLPNYKPLPGCSSYREVPDEDLLDELEEYWQERKEAVR